STPTTSVLSVVPVVLPPPPHPVAASATTANAPITLIRLFIYFLSLLYPVRGDRRARSGTGPSTVGEAADEPAHSWRTGQSYWDDADRSAAPESLGDAAVWSWSSGCVSMELDASRAWV